jgi:hypothetical protein
MRISRRFCEIPTRLAATMALGQEEADLAGRRPPFDYNPCAKGKKPQNVGQLEHFPH